MIINIFKLITTSNKTIKVFLTQNLFGTIPFAGIPLYQFFSYHLSRKAEGNGPLKPWQPILLLHSGRAGKRCQFHPLRRRDRSDLQLQISTQNIKSSSDLWMSLLVMAHHREITSSSFHANWLY